VVGLSGSTCEQMVSQVIRWLELRYGVVIRAFDAVISEVCKGLKRRSGAGLGSMMLPVQTFVFGQKVLRQRGDERSLLLADASLMRFLGFRRVSETALTTSHNGREVGKDARLLLHCNVEWDRANFWAHWPRTKNSVNLRRPFSSKDDLIGEGFGCYTSFCARSVANEKFLSEHPDYDREKLPFFHLGGVPLHRRDVELSLSELCQLAFDTEPAMGHLDPKWFRITTHSERKGGSCFYLRYIRGSEAYVRWMGDWSSLAFFTYAKVSHELATATMSQANGVLKAMFR